MDMISNRRVGRRPIREGIPGLPPAEGESPLYPGPNLTYHRNGVRWQFEQNKVWINEFDVDSLISERGEDIGYWFGLADGLNDYRKKMLHYVRQRDSFNRFEAVVDALLGKLGRRLKKSYDKKMSGIGWSIENGQFILNGINVRSLLALYRLRKTEKALKFLRGLKRQLAALMKNETQSQDYERVRELVEALYLEFDDLVPEETVRAALLLPQRTDH